MPLAGSVRRASASAPGTCGELAQGMLDGVLCMVTCPIDMRSTATVELSPGNGSISAPSDSPKASQAILATLEYLGESAVDAELSLDSKIPRGKGMASSTADVSSAIVATASALGREISAEEIASIALGIEPSDGVMFPKIVIFDHLRGPSARTLGSPPPMHVAILDFGGEVDTLEFNKAAREDALGSLQPRWLKHIPDRTGIGETPFRRSVRGLPPLHANRKYSQPPRLYRFRRKWISRRKRGPQREVSGLLFPDDAALAERAAAIAPHHLDCLESVLQCRLTGGGVWRLRDPSSA